MTAKYVMRANVALAALAGLALRIFFVLKLPVTDSGDAPFYIELAWNWLKKGVYGGVVEGQLMPLDTRVPGYPAFLAAIFSVAGNSSRAAMLTQAVVDLATCFVVVLIAVRVANEVSRRRVGLVLAVKWRRPTNWMNLARAGVLMGVGLLLPLLPWAARNWHTLHETQFLAPRYLQMPDDFAPVGFNAWTGTWLWRFRDVYTTLWRLNSEEIPLASIPAQAFDSPQERAQVAEMLESYNYTLTLSREQDAEFGKIARERTANQPLRTYVKIPLLRALTLWFTPRVELLPTSSPLRPIESEWEDDRLDFLVTLGMALLNAAYVALALAGAWLVRKRPGVAFLIVFVVLRTAFISGFIETPEPRYVLECFPAVLALAAQAFGGRRQLSSTGSG